jgi:hypothetical protein
MENCINIYNEFLETTNNLTDNDISSLTNNNVNDHLNSFYQSLSNDDLFSVFTMAKIKLFSAKTEETHRVSTSLFGEELTLKQIFNNQSDIIKNKLWELLFNLYIQLERINNNNADRIALLKDSLKKMRSNTSNSVKNDIFKNVLNADVNNTTSNMLDDIIGSFQDVVSNKGNPFESIMGITEMITSKYGNMIENGEVEIDKILGGMGGLLTKGMNGMTGMGEEKKEEPVIINDEFSTADVDVGKEEDKKAGGMFNFANFAKFAPLAEMVTKINAVKNEDDINALKKDMDNFMEKELKVDMSQYKGNMEKLEKQLEEAKFKDKVVEVVDMVEPTEYTEHTEHTEHMEHLEHLD